MFCKFIKYHKFSNTNSVLTPSEFSVVTLATRVARVTVDALPMTFCDSLVLSLNDDHWSQHG